jgi:hypothetical protein
MADPRGKTLLSEAPLVTRRTLRRRYGPSTVALMA